MAVRICILATSPVPPQCEHKGAKGFTSYDVGVSVSLGIEGPEAEHLGAFMGFGSFYEAVQCGSVKESFGQGKVYLTSNHRFTT
jgi:hypothetical protein